MTDEELEKEKIRLLAACDQALSLVPQEQEPSLIGYFIVRVLLILYVVIIAILPAVVCYFYVNKDWSILVFCTFVIYNGIYDFGDRIANMQNVVASRISAVAYVITNLANQVGSVGKSCK